MLDIEFRDMYEDYVDVDVFIQDPNNDGADWDFMISKTRANGTFDISAVTYAENENAGFYDIGEPPPYLVMKELALAMPTIVDFINECEVSDDQS